MAKPRDLPGFHAAGVRGEAGRKDHGGRGHDACGCRGGEEAQPQPDEQVAQGRRGQLNRARIESASQDAVSIRAHFMRAANSGQWRPKSRAAVPLHALQAVAVIGLVRVGRRRMGRVSHCSTSYRSGRAGARR